MKEKDCPFCKLYKEATKDNYVGFDESPRNFYPVLHFEPLNPVTPGHRLFIQSYHQGSENSTIVGENMAAAATWGRDRGEQFNLILNSGEDASQTIPHMHVHYVPRHKGDGLILPWTNQEKK